jgi:hypothetical protein
MTLLSKKLEDVRARHVDQAGHELAQVLALGEHVAELDERLLSALDDVLEEHGRRRAAVHDRLETIARCVGRMPPPARLEAEEPQQLGAAAGDDDPLPTVLERERLRQVAAGGLPPASHHYGDLNGTPVQ